MYYKLLFPVRFVNGNTAQYVNSDLANYIQISDVEVITIYIESKQNSINRIFQPIGMKHRPLSSFTMLKKQVC